MYNVCTVLRVIQQSVSRYSRYRRYSRYAVVTSVTAVTAVTAVTSENKNHGGLELENKNHEELLGSCAWATLGTCIPARSSASVRRGE